MLLVPANEFNWTVDNWTSSLLDGSFGTTVAPHGSFSHTKGTAVSLIGGGTVTEDVYGVAITFSNSVAVGQNKRYLCDLLIDPAGGSSWSTIINNLICPGTALQQGGYNYYFPLYLKSGTSIGMQLQASNGGSPRVGVKLYGKPSRPDLVKCGTKVESFGATTGSTEGTAINPGNQVAGAWTSMGTTTDDLWWWQWGGILYNDTSLTLHGGTGDVACGDASNKKICLDSNWYHQDANETSIKSAFGFQNIRHIKGGETVYVRAFSSAASDETSPSTMVYGLGG